MYISRLINTRVWRGHGTPGLCEHTRLRGVLILASPSLPPKTVSPRTFPSRRPYRWYRARLSTQLLRYVCMVFRPVTYRVRCFFTLSAKNAVRQYLLKCNASAKYFKYFSAEYWYVLREKNKKKIVTLIVSFIFLLGLLPRKMSLVYAFSVILKT